MAFAGQSITLGRAAGGVWLGIQGHRGDTGTPYSLALPLDQNGPDWWRSLRFPHSYNRTNNARPKKVRRVARIAYYVGNFLFPPA